MVQEVILKILPKDILNEALVKQKAAQQAGLSINDITHLKIIRRSIDARNRQPYYRLQIEVYQGAKPMGEPAILKMLHPLQKQGKLKKVIVVGAGPAGYFTALELLALGIQPIVFDRGKDIQQRRRDLKAIQQHGKVNPNSNYCFGEGGAGTYSDGKLYTRSHKRGNIKKILQLLVEHGAKSDILIDAHPHIGSNKLPKIVANIRTTILEYGGAIHFNARVTDLILHQQAVKGVVVNEEVEHFADAVVLATGHSARDIFYLLHQKGIKIEAKPFALGIRIEHPQPLIDKIQYGQQDREENLPASSYRIACQIKDRGVYSFCMCPGGLVVPAATAPGEIVVNGMSLSKRNSPFANSGMVVALELSDLKDFAHEGIFAGLAFQKSIEQTMFQVGDGSQKAPAQRMTDFVKNKRSAILPNTSYIPGLHSAKVSELLPDFVYQRLRKGMLYFGKRLRGYYTAEANIIGTESRTSSPIRIPRDRTTYMHPDIKGLFPCGEGAGYAGGIISAALDGQNVARAVKAFLE